MRRLFAALAVVAAVGAGCGGGGTPANEYADGICQATNDWVTALSSGGEVLEGLDENSSPEEGKQALTSYLDDVVATTDQVIAQLNDLGEPDVENGAKIHDALISTFEQSKTIFEDARADAEDIPTDSAEAFNAAATKIDQDINTSFDALNGSMQGIEKDIPQELKDAVDQAQACQSSDLFS